jgi:heme exporter protein B
VWGEIALVAGKDLRIERRSRVGSTQIAPFAVAVVVLFGFALEGDTATLRAFTGGLFWVTVLFTAVLAVQRSFTVESVNDNRDALRLSGLDPTAIFVGKAAALVVELLLLELVLGFVVAVLYDSSIESPGLLVATAVVATIAVATAGTIYGVLAASLRVRETILPLLLLPVLAPVLIAATRAFEDALGEVAVDGWDWFVLLTLTAIVYSAFGALAFGTLLEES